MDAPWDPLPWLAFTYDIRPAPEDLYLAVLACRLEQDRSR